VSHTLFRSTFAPGSSDDAIDLIVVTLEQGEVVSQQQISRRFQLAFSTSLKSTLGFNKAIEEKKAGRKIGVPDLHVGFGSD
jgi:hypothetical protein